MQMLICELARVIYRSQNDQLGRNSGNHHIRLYTTDLGTTQVWTASVHLYMDFFDKYTTVLYTYLLL